MKGCVSSFELLYYDSTFAVGRVRAGVGGSLQKQARCSSQIAAALASIGAYIARLF